MNLFGRIDVILIENQEERDGYLIGLSETVDASHFALLIGIGEDAHGRLFARDAQDEILATFLGDVLTQFAQQARGPFLFHLSFLVLQKPFTNYD